MASRSAKGGDARLQPSGRFVLEEQDGRTGCYGRYLPATDPGRLLLPVGDVGFFGLLVLEWGGAPVLRVVPVHLSGGV